MPVDSARIATDLVGRRAYLRTSPLERVPVQISTVCLSPDGWPRVYVLYRGRLEHVALDRLEFDR